MQYRTLGLLVLALAVGGMAGLAGLYATDDVLTAAIAGLVWPIGFSLLALYDHRYPDDVFDNEWGYNRDGALVLVLILAMGLLAGFFPVLDPQVIYVLVVGVGLIGYMGGILHMAENTGVPAEDD